MCRHCLINVAIPRWLLVAAPLASCALLFSATPAAAHVDYFRVNKGVIYPQTANNTQPTTPYDNGFYGRLDLGATPGDIASASAVSTTAPLLNYVLTQSSTGYWSWAQYFNSLTQLDSALPVGHTYRFNISGGALGAQSALSPTPANNLFSPSIPYFVGTTFDQLQGLDPSAPFTLRWNAFAAPFGANDLAIFLSIVRISDSQPVYSVGLNNATTSHQLSAITLAPNTEYRAELIFSSRVDTPNAGFTVASGLVDFDLVTDLQFKTGERLPGDYNRNHVVDAADYTLWRNTLGQINVTPYTGADGDGDGKILRADYDVWEANYGLTSPASGSLLTAVPEPSAANLLLCGLFAASLLPRRGNRAAGKRR
jgi:hypothetical protein